MPLLHDMATIAVALVALGAQIAVSLLLTGWVRSGSPHGWQERPRRTSDATRER